MLRFILRTFIFSHLFSSLNEIKFSSKTIILQQENTKFVRILRVTIASVVIIYSNEIQLFVKSGCLFRVFI